MKGENGENGAMKVGVMGMLFGEYELVMATVLNARMASTGAALSAKQGKGDGGE